MAKRKTRDPQRDAILEAYSSAKEQDSSLTPAEFMMLSQPGRHKIKYRGRVYDTAYSSSDSARRQFDKLEKGEMSGAVLYKRGANFTRRYREMDNVYTYQQRGRGMYEHGKWKVVVHMNWTDNDGREHYDEMRSFIVQSEKYDNYFDAKNVELATADAVEDHVAAWEEDYGVGEVDILYVEVIRIQSTTKTKDYIVEIE